MNGQRNCPVRFQPYPIKLNSINATNNKNVLAQNNNNNNNNSKQTFKSTVFVNYQPLNENHQRITSILKKANFLPATNNQVHKFQFNKNPPQPQQKTLPKPVAAAKSDVISNLVFHQPLANNYDLRDYKETNSTMRNKSKQQQQPTQTQTVKKVTNENLQLKVLTATTEKIKAYQETLQNKHSSILFETIAQLDSVIIDYPNNGRQFYVKDPSNENHLSSRMQCIFHEIDRKLPNLVRGSYIRCVGHYNTKKKLFVCYSVRSALQSELIAFAAYVDSTDQSIFQNL